MERKGQPFTCYFCNKKVENESEIGHTSVCGNVLRPCPNKCGAYVPRMDMQKHKGECLNRIGRSMPRLNDISTFNEGNLTNSTSLDRRVNGANRDNVRDMFFSLQNDIQKLSIRLSKHEQTGFNTAPIHQNMEMLQNNQTILKQELGKIKQQNQLVNEWKMNLDYKLDSLKQNLAICERSRSESEIHWMNFQQKIMVLEKLQMDLNLLKETFMQDQSLSREASLELVRRLEVFRDQFDQENATVGAIWNDQNNLIEGMLRDIDTIKATADEQKAKQSSVIFDVKTVTQIASEAAERVEIQERQLRDMENDMIQLKLDLEILEGLAASETAASFTPGHIMWKIDDFDAKITKARESNSVVKSQIFYTHQFGYKIRVLVYLNGLKKWKDRYALISIHVLKGEYDALLKWPCHIEGSVTLRDLESPENAKNFSKYINAKRQSGDEDNEEPQESSSSYIFIPHTTLTKSKYLKDDTIYLEIKIEQSKKSLAETTL